MDIQYAGEHLLYGKIGHLFIITAFAAVLLSSISYFLSSKNKLENDSWKSIARAAFGVHTLSVFGIIAILFFLIKKHFFEYYYVWHHSSLLLPTRYMFACFWEGQEGSFLLWTFWHCILSFFIIKKSGEWEAPVMAVISIVQVFLSSMLLGI